jgi:hypothetical protein
MYNGAATGNLLRGCTRREREEKTMTSGTAKPDVTTKARGGVSSIGTMGRFLKVGT